MIDARYWAKLLIEMKSVAWPGILRDEERVDQMIGECFVSWATHLRARNSQTYIRNDPRDDLNESNDATDPVDDDSVTNYTHQIIISRDKKLENNREGSRARVDPTCLSRDLCICVGVSWVCFEMSNHLLPQSFHKHLTRLSPALRTLYNSVFWQVSAETFYKFKISR